MLERRRARPRATGWALGTEDKEARETQRCEARLPVRS